jgi:hypothetical protein
MGLGSEMGDPVKSNTGSRTPKSQKRRRIPDLQHRFLEYNYAASKAMKIKLKLSRTLKFAEMEKLVVIQIFFHPGSGSRGQKSTGSRTRIRHAGARSRSYCSVVISMCQKKLA